MSYVEKTELIDEIILYALSRGAVALDVSRLVCWLRPVCLLMFASKNTYVSSLFYSCSTAVVPLYPDFPYNCKLTLHAVPYAYETHLSHVPYLIPHATHSHYI